LCSKGISTGDFSEALAALLGTEAPGLSASTVTRLKSVWEEEYRDWSKRSLEGKQYVYVWADGVHFNIRLEEDRQCILVLMGATADGKKELIAVADGYRESEQSWKALLLDVKARGLKVDPKLATGDGALGFWKALRKVYPKTREQRCWVHKTANVLDNLPKRLQPEAKQKLHDIWTADTREHAHEAFDLFVATYKAKYPKAVECLVKGRDVLLTFYDFPAEHWIHLRTTNPIESTFATVRLRTKRTKGSGTRTACLTMVSKLMQSAAKRWRSLNGADRRTTGPALGLSRSPCRGTASFRRGATCLATPRPPDRQPAVPSASSSCGMISKPSASWPRKSAGCTNNVARCPACSESQIRHKGLYSTG